MTHVPWSGDTPRSPAIAGIDTLAIDVSSTFMNVASDSAIVPSSSVGPDNGAGLATAVAAACVSVAVRPAGTPAAAVVVAIKRLYSGWATGARALRALA